MTRRTFLGASAAAVIAGGTLVRGRAEGANSRIRVAVIGLHGQGGGHMNFYLQSGDAELVALCDPDEHVLDRRAGEAEAKSGKKPKTFTDVRDLIADDTIDAVSIATPHHWHTLASVWSAMAGKHVYVEKPAAWSVYEGQQLVAASKKLDVIMQHGTQRRSSAGWIRDIALLRSGEIIGPVYMARGLCYKNGNRGSLGFKDDSPPPEYLHWDLWQGPAARREYNPNYVHYNWHWFWRYGNGEIGNQGIHQMDVAVWGINKGMPVKVSSDGGRYTYEDMGETPNTNVATFKYPDGTMTVFEVRNRFTNDEAGVSVGNLFYADGGYYVEGQGFFDKKNQKIDIDETVHPYPEVPGCFQTYLNAIKSGRKEDIHGTMEDAHLGATHCHLANISYRLDRSLSFDPETETFLDDSEANDLLSRDYTEGFEVPKLA